MGAAETSIEANVASNRGGVQYAFQVCLVNQAKPWLDGMEDIGRRKLGDWNGTPAVRRGTAAVMSCLRGTACSRSRTGGMGCWGHFRRGTYLPKWNCFSLKALTFPIPSRQKALCIPLKYRAPIHAIRPAIQRLPENLFGGAQSPLPSPKPLVRCPTLAGPFKLEPGACPIENWIDLISVIQLIHELQFEMVCSVG